MEMSILLAAKNVPLPGMHQIVILGSVAESRSDWSCPVRTAFRKERGRRGLHEERHWNTDPPQAHLAALMDAPVRDASPK